jgi:hypothetical protein
VHIDQCRNKKGLVLHSCIASHILDIATRVIRLTSLFPGERKAEEYSRLPIPLSGKGKEVHFA